MKNIALLAIKDKEYTSIEVFKSQKEFSDFLISIGIKEFKICKFKETSYNYKFNNVFFIFNNELVHLILPTAWNITSKIKLKELLIENKIIKKEVITKIEETTEFITFK